MRWLLTLVLVFTSVLSSFVAYAIEDDAYLSLRSVNDDNDAVRYIKRTDYFKVGVYGSKDFTLQLLDSYPGEINEQWMFLSTGEALPVIDSYVTYNCAYYMLYFGLAVSTHSDDTISAIPFWFTPAWKPKDRDLIPTESPDPVSPVSDNQSLSLVINKWWITEVKPYLELQELEKISSKAG